jgi:prepilin-type N-terminal cleavage/methylation domain-containing protein
LADISRFPRRGWLVSTGAVLAHRESWEKPLSADGIALALRWREAKTMKNSTQRHRTHHDQRGFTLIELLIVLGIVAILSAIGIASVKDVLNRARAARTASDLLIVSNVIEQYTLDNGSFPDVDGLGPVSQIEHLVVPRYTGHLPTTDGWGNVIFYERIVASGKNDNSSGGAGGQESWVVCHRTESELNPEETITVAQPSILQAHLRHGDSLGECADEPEEEADGMGTRPLYRVYSYGRDGLPDGDTVTGLYYGSSSDIVVENGMLVQWAF